MAENISSIFGIDEDTLEKTKDIYPTLEIGKLEEGCSIIGVLDSEIPKSINIEKKKFLSAEEKKIIAKGEKVLIEQKIIPIKVLTFEKINSSGEKVEIPYNGEKMTLWLSSKSLALSLARIYETHKSLKGLVVKITVTTTNYKDFGENRCYNVSVIE